MSRLNRANVVAASLEILETGGSAALTIPALATKLKIRPPSLYNHIESISDLKRELSIHSMGLAYETRRKAASGKSCDEAVLANARAYRQFACEHPALYQLSIAIPPASDEQWTEAFNKSRNHWLEILEGYSFETLERRYVVRSLRSAVHGFVDLEVNGGWLEDIDLDKSFEAMMQLLLGGLHSAERDRIFP